MTDAPNSAGLVALADRIELWPIEKLRPYERNPRTHSDEQVDQIAASMVEFGWTNPVLIDEQGGILAGHGRLLAARKLALAEVPVIRLEHLSETQKRAYLIADNQLALQAGWSEELLAGELAWLRDESFDLDLVGFDASELERLLALANGESDSDEAEDEVPEPPEDSVSKPGDLWVLGSHRLLCGDATVLADVERVLGGQLADMTFCDPPYNVDYANTPKDKLRDKHRPILNDNLGGGFEAFLYDACVNILSVTKGACYVCMSSSELDTLQCAFRAAGGKWSTFVIWAKNTFTLGRADYQRQYEPILYGWKDGADHYWCGARDQGDVLLLRGVRQVLPFVSAGDTVLSGVRRGPAHDGVRACGPWMSGTWSPIGANNKPRKVTDTPSRQGHRPPREQRNSGRFRHLCSDRGLLA